MCFEVNAVPPELPPHLSAHLLSSSGADGGMGGTSAGQQVTLTSADGTELAAYVARPAAPSGAGIVILPDVRGLFHFYEELAQRFAAAGVEAIAIDYFGRTAGMAPRPDDFDFMAHVAQVKLDQVTQDVAAAVAYLRGMPGARVSSIFTVGFCFGGFLSFLQGMQHHGLAGVIGFYGNPAGTQRFPGVSPTAQAAQYECPVLGLFGGADQGIPAESVQQFDQALAAAGIEHELITYPGAPHSFFDRTYQQYQAESADAWQRMLSFIRAHTPPRA
jgi:carboxymethylenebutenolidase